MTAFLLKCAPSVLFEMLKAHVSLVIGSQPVLLEPPPVKLKSRQEIYQLQLHQNR